MATKKVSAADLFAAFNKLPEGEQLAFVAMLPENFAASHPSVVKLLDWMEQHQRDREKEHFHKLVEMRRELHKHRNRGKLGRNQLIVAKLREGLTYGQIGRDPDVVAANDGKRMKRGAVEAVVRRERDREERFRASLRIES